MRVLVCGGRDFSDRAMLFEKLDTINPSHIIHGGASGADALAGRWAEARCIPFTVYPANWNKHGKAAGPMRNQQMLDEAKPDLVVAFPGGRGTEDMCQRAAQTGFLVMRVFA